MPRKGKIASTVLHWVVLRDEDTKKLISSRSFKTLKEATGYKIELEEAAGAGEVTVETLPVGQSPR